MWSNEDRSQESAMLHRTATKRGLKTKVNGRKTEVQRSLGSHVPEEKRFTALGSTGQALIVRRAQRVSGIVVDGKQWLPRLLPVPVIGTGTLPPGQPRARDWTKTGGADFGGVAGSVLDDVRRLINKRAVIVRDSLTDRVAIIHPPFAQLGVLEIGTSK